MKRTVPILIVILFIGSLIVGNAGAHFVQTHQKIISLAMDTLINDDMEFRNGLNSQYINLLETTIVEDGVPKTYLRKLMEGVRDADKIVNGLFGFPKVWDDCYDWNLNQNCSFGITYEVVNSIEHWPVGDHGYNPGTEKGFNSLIDISTYMNEMSAWHPDAFVNLLNLIADLYPNDDPMEKLENIFQNSNAVDMAEHFYEKAKEEWSLSNYGEAMYNLGIALHAIQDMTVPHHTRLLGDEKPEQWDNNEVFYSHKNYEKLIWEEILGSGNRNQYDFDSPMTGEYIRKSARDWAIENANKSVDPSITSLNPFSSGDDVIIQATISTVGTIFSFFEDVGDGGDNDFYLLSGTLTYADGSPAQGSINAYSTSDYNSNSVFAFGNYELALFPGEYSVDTQFYFLNDNSQSSTYVFSFGLGQTISVQSNTTLDLQAPDYTFYHISGIITDDQNNEISGVKVDAYGGNQYTSTNDSTDIEGAFDLMVTAGTYKLDITPKEGSLLKAKQIENLQIDSDLPLNINLSPSDTVLSGTVKYSDGTPARGWIYIRENNVGSYSSYNFSNGQFQIGLNPGEHQIFARVYQYSNTSTDYIRTPYSTINVSGNTPIDFIVEYSPFSVTGVVTDINNVPKENVNINASSSDNRYISYAYSDMYGNYQLNLPTGTYRLQIDPPASLYPDLNIEKLVVSGDRTRNIRLSREYNLIDDALAVLPPELDVALDVFEIINLADTLNYDIIVKGTKDLLEIVLNWGGSEMKVSVHDPDGIFYGEYQDTDPPIIVKIPNPKQGTWRCEVEAIEIPHTNYPFALVAGISENQRPIAAIGGPYSGSVNESLQFDASESYDPDGNIVLYEWDWNNDGIFDESTLNSEASHIWTTPYDGDIRLKVTDDGGLAKITSTPVTIVGATDCNGDPGGSAILDNCNECVGGNTGKVACVQDCNGDWGGTASIDNCNECVGGNTGKTACVQDCNGDWGGAATIDNCNECVGGNTGKVACVIIPGDFDGDGDIDKFDINVIKSYRNQPASVMPECDIDGDGKITVLDARKLMMKCTLPRCVSP